MSSTITLDILRDPNTSAKDLVPGALHKFFLFRALVALHDNCPEDLILEMLATEQDPSVLSAIARSNKIERTLFILLSQHADEAVRSGAASNPNLNLHGGIAARLREDPSRQVRESLERNHNSRR